MITVSNRSNDARALKNWKNSGSNISTAVQQSDGHWQYTNSGTNSQYVNNPGRYDSPGRVIVFQHNAVANAVWLENVTMLIRQDGLIVGLTVGTGNHHALYISAGQSVTVLSSGVYMQAEWETMQRYGIVWAGPTGIALA